MMVTQTPLRPADVRDLPTLRRFVTQTLCGDFELLEGAFPVTEQFLHRRGTPCGIHFCIHGPRAVRLTAIWESGRSRVLFYGEHGQRIRSVEIPHTIPLP